MKKATATLPKIGEIEALITPAAEDARSALAACQAIVVTTAAEAENAAESLREVAQRRDDLDRMRKRWVDPLKGVAKEIDEAFRPAIKSLEAAEAAIKAALGGYARAEEARRLAAVRAIAEEAERARRIEAARVAEEEAAEAQRAEAARKAASLARSAERAEEMRAAEETRRAEAARRAEEAALAASRAEAARNTALAVAAALESPKIAGVSVRMEWTGEVVDASQIPREYMTPDVAKLTAATKTAGHDPGIAGWRAFQSERVRTSRRTEG